MQLHHMLTYTLKKSELQFLFNAPIFSFLVWNFTHTEAIMVSGGP